LSVTRWFNESFNSMSAYKKGNQSRDEIVNISREIFNNMGIHITLKNLAESMNSTMGKLTHHFPNKDFLFIAIAQDYEDKLAELRSKRNFNSFDFGAFITVAAEVMDLQYDYRCAVRYNISSLNTQSEVKTHLSETYQNSSKSIRNTINALVDAGSLNSKVLEDKTYEVFLFQITNLFTNWVINLELYDIGKTYTEMKPVYLKGIISIFLPFLTEKGFRELTDNIFYSSY